MEAATPLRHPHVRTLGDRLAIDGLSLADETAVRLVRAREEAGEDAVAAVVDAIEIGARVLDREQTGANAEFVKTEFEKVSAQVQRAFGDEARTAAETLQGKLEEVFGPENGHLAKAMARHFDDGSAGAVQNRVREVVNEVMARSREDLLKQFSSAEGSNPLAEFKARTVAVLKQASDTQETNLRALLDKMAALEKELQGLRDERDKRADIEAVADKGTAKGRSFEQAVYDAIDVLAQSRGDVADAVGDVRGTVGRVGDVLVSIDACAGPARGRIVFEAKSSRLSRPRAVQELDEARADRDAQFAVLVVPSEEKVPARMSSLREYNGDKLIVAFDPEEPSTLALEVAYSLARARVLMHRGGEEGVDAAAIADTVQRAVGAMDEVRSIKQKLTGARTSIDSAESVLDGMVTRVRELLGQISELTAPAQDAAEPEDGASREPGAEPPLFS